MSDKRPCRTLDRHRVTMATITAEERAELCRRVSLLDLMTEDGLEVRQAGGHWLVKLRREENTASCRVWAPGTGREGHKDYWSTPFGEQEESIKKVPAPSTMDQAVNTVAEILGTDKDKPHCAHGAMVWKAGVTKAGKPWGHYKCSGAANGHNERCPKDQDVVWYEIKPDGSWGAQKVRA